MNNRETDMKYTSHLLSGAAVVMLSLFSTQAMAGECEPAKAAEKYPDLATRTVNIATSPTFPQGNRVKDYALMRFAR